MHIKDIIIIVLTILLVIVVCFYSYLASQMQDYEKKRLELIEKLTSRKRSDIIREAMFRFIKSDYPEFIVE